MIHARFDEIRNLANQDCNVTIKRSNIMQAPDVGETISIDGNPYIVHGRGWALADENDKYDQYVFITVIPAFDSGNWK